MFWSPEHHNNGTTLMPRAGVAKLLSMGKKVPAKTFPNAHWTFLKVTFLENFTTPPDRKNTIIGAGIAFEMV